MPGIAPLAIYMLIVVINVQILSLNLNLPGKGNIFGRMSLKEHSFIDSMVIECLFTPDPLSNTCTYRQIGQSLILNNITARIMMTVMTLSAYYMAGTLLSSLQVLALDSFFFFFFFFCFLGPHPWHMLWATGKYNAPSAYGIAQARGWIRAAAAGHSHVCNLHHSSWQCRILNPWITVRNQTFILMDTSWICFCCATMGTPWKTNILF